MSTRHAQPEAATAHYLSRNAAHDHDVTATDLSIGVVIGRLTGFFDFFVFGIACVLVFPQVFFPFADQLHGLFYSFAIFALAFIGQPLGSLFFLPMQRRHGRGVKLTVALFILGTATVLIALLPGYDTLGPASIAALAILRFFQGFGVGGSWNGLASLLALKAPPERRGWYAAIPQLGAPVGFIIAAALFAYIDYSLSAEQFIEWGWRYPFFVAFAVNVVALFARLRLVVSPEYEKLMDQSDLNPAPVGELIRNQGKPILLGAFASLASYALFHLITIFTLCWAIMFTKQSPLSFLIVQIIGALVAMPCMMLSGHIADRIGRRHTLGLFAVLIAIYSGWTALLLAGGTTASYVFIIIGFALLGFSHAQSAGAITSSFRSYYRYAGARLTSDLAWLMGAAFAPLVALGLAWYLGVGFVGLYLLSGAACTLAALWVTRSSTSSTAQP